MTSKIKVDNIENQCGGAVVTKCGVTTTIAGTNVNATTVTATNVVGSTAVKSDNIQASDGGNLINQCGTTITLGASGDTINLAAGASQTGFGRTGTVNWDTTPKTSTVTAANGVGYFVDTTSGSITVNLPAGTAGAIVAVADYANTADTNKIVITPNGTEKIQGASNSFEITVEGGSVTLVYVDSTQGWRPTDASTAAAIIETNTFIVATGGTITCCGDYKIHTFTGPGTFCVSAAGGTVAKADYMVIAGGGSGGTGFNAIRVYGGGGAGGFRESVPSPAAWSASPLAAPGGTLPISVQGYPITVGGGAGINPAASHGSPGSDSIFSTITSKGGGAGGGPPSPQPAVYTGGSGGGGGWNGAAATPGAAGNTPPVSPPQGNPGGNGTGPDINAAGGGGGGAGGAGSNSGTRSGGNGGNGVTTSINASPVTRAGGGGGGGGGGGPAGGPVGSGGSGGSGGGGAGAAGGSSAGSGSVNTGSGGGATGNSPSAGAGGSGIVIIRYKFQ